MRKSAFTLIELSIVLVIMGLLVGGSFKVLQMMRERAQITRAQDDVKVAKEAIIGNAIVNGKTLPDGTFFQEHLSPVKSNQHPLLYVYANNLTQKNICSFKTTNLKVRKITPTQTVDIDNIAFVVASEGANRNMQTAKQGNIVKTYTYELKRDDNISPVNIVEYYDDVVEWVTLAQLQSRLECAREPLRIVNTSLPSTDVNNSNDYEAKIVIDGNYSTATLVCSFPSSDNNFSYDNNNFSITSSGNHTLGVVEVDCTVTEDEKTVKKKFAITVNP
ncbi:MAG TPA: type II secretion system protein [Sulfurimonas autotrophica]|nr:type II secretion system protein [Sulfurimonas autotrophica]